MDSNQAIAKRSSAGPLSVTGTLIPDPTIAPKPSTMHTTYEPAKPNQPQEPYFAPQKVAEYQSVEPSHPVWLGYIFWIFGFTGAHRFYYGKTLTGILWFFTGGLFLIGWLIDVVLIPGMAEEAEQRYTRGRLDYAVAWLLHMFLGIFGVHRLYMGKIVTGLLWLLTGGLFGIGYVYDTLTLNDQVDEINRRG